MSTNQERVAEVLYREGAYCGECGWAETLDCPDCRTVISSYVRALVDAGLLAPELPEANDPTASFVPDGKGWLCHTADTTRPAPVVWTAVGGRVMIQRIEPGELTPEEARKFALNVLAAAEHAETGRAGQEES